MTVTSTSRINPHCRVWVPYLPPTHLITLVHHSVVVSRGPLRRILTLGPKPGTHSKKKLHKIEENPKFLLQPYFYFVNWLVILASSEVH
jgi:hypothetical protein